MCRAIHDHQSGVYWRASESARRTVFHSCWDKSQVSMTHPEYKLLQHTSQNASLLSSSLIQYVFMYVTSDDKPLLSRICVMLE